MTTHAESDNLQFKEYKEYKELILNEYRGILSEESYNRFVIHFSEEEEELEKEVKSSISLDIINRLCLKNGSLLVVHEIPYDTEIRSGDTFFNNEGCFLCLCNNKHSYSKFYSPISGNDLGEHIDYFKFTSGYINNKFYICEVLSKYDSLINGSDDIFKFSLLRGMLTGEHDLKKQLISKEIRRNNLLIKKDFCDFRIKKHLTRVYELTCGLSKTNDFGLKQSKKSIESIEFTFKSCAEHALKINKDVHKRKCIEMMLSTV